MLSVLYLPGDELTEASNVNWAFFKVVGFPLPPSPFFVLFVCLVLLLLLFFASSAKNAQNPRETLATQAMCK